MVDESSLTGEGALVEKTSSVLLFNEAAADLPIAERTNIIFMVRGGRRRETCGLGFKHGTCVSSD
jgi:magnesium-transporting ATPase (P-type)